MGPYLRVGVGCGCVPLQGGADVRHALQDVVRAVLLALLIQLCSDFFHVLFDLLVLLGEVFRDFLGRREFSKRGYVKML